MSDPGPPSSVCGDLSPGGASGDPGPPPGAEPDTGPPPLSREMVGYFWRFLRPDLSRFWLATALVIIVGVVPALAGLAPALLTSTWQSGDLSTLRLGLVGLLALSIIGVALNFVISYLFARVSQGFSRRLRLAIFEKVGTLPAVAMSQQSIGSLAHRSTGDVMTMQEMVTPNLPTAVSCAAQVLFLSIALFWLSPPFAAVALLITPLIVLVARLINRRVNVLARSSQLESEAAMTRFIEGTAGFRDLVAAGKFDEATRGLDRHLAKLQKLAVRTSIFGFASGAFPMFCFTLMVFGFYLLKTSQVDMVGDAAFIGRVISFAGLLTMLQPPVIQLANFFTEAALASPSFHEVRRLLEGQSVGLGGSARLDDSDATIRLEGLDFAYNEGAPPVIDQLDAVFADGSYTAVIGQTGSGKTTLFYLLLRLIEPTGGRIAIGGHDLSEIDLAHLRDTVGFIPQAPFIFDASIRENLLMGDPVDRYADEEIGRALELSQLDRLVKKREAQGGIDAPVGAAGATLSGGERQRIALARVLLRRPRILVCDEYTANIDNETASLIQAALQREFAGHTRIVITHQLYSVRDADSILFLSNGRIAESGTHEELFAANGLYRGMWDVQRLA